MSILADYKFLFVRKIYSFLSILILCSCNSKKQDDTKLVFHKEKANIAVKHVIATPIKSEFLKEVENWKEYKVVAEFATKFQKTSPNEALSNALEMKNIIISLKDSLKPTLFNSPSFIARINVLHNEAERLADITFIPAIKTAEINEQVEKTLQAFSALNAKVNIVLSQKKFEDAIEISTEFIGLDTTKVDAVSKKSIADFDKKQTVKNRKILKPNLPDFNIPEKGEILQKAKKNS